MYVHGISNDQAALTTNQINICGSNGSGACLMDVSQRTYVTMDYTGGATSSETRQVVNTLSFAVRSLQSRITKQKRVGNMR